MKIKFHYPDRDEAEVLEVVEGRMTLKNALNSLNRAPSGTQFSVSLVHDGQESAIVPEAWNQYMVEDGDEYRLKALIAGGGTQ